MKVTFVDSALKEGSGGSVGSVSWEFGVMSECWLFCDGKVVSVGDGVELGVLSGLMVLVGACEPLCSSG